MACSEEIICDDCEVGRAFWSSGRLNHSWKLSRSLKMSGRMKLSKDQSSARLFWEEINELENFR